MGPGMTRCPDSGSMVATGPRCLPLGETAGRTAATVAPDRGSTIGIGSRFRPCPAAAPTESSTLRLVLGSMTSRTLRAWLLPCGWGPSQQVHCRGSANKTKSWCAARRNPQTDQPNQTRLYAAHTARNSVTRIPPFKNRFILFVHANLQTISMSLDISSVARIISGKSDILKSKGAHFILVYGTGVHPLEFVVRRCGTFILFQLSTPCHERFRLPSTSSVPSYGVGFANRIQKGGVWCFSVYLAFGGPTPQATWAQRPLRGCPWVLEYPYWHQMIIQTHPSGEKGVWERSKF